MKSVKAAVGVGLCILLSVSSGATAQRRVPGNDATQPPPAATTPAAPAPAPSEAPATPAPAETPPAASPSAAPSQVPQPQVHAIWDYQKQIGLSDDQVARIKKTIKDLQTKANAARTPWMTTKDQLDKLLEKDNSDLAAIRSKMQTLANIEIDMKLENLKAVRALHKIMTPQQMAKWRDIQKSEQGGSNSQ